MSRKTLVFLVFLFIFNFCNAEDIKKPIYIEGISSVHYNDLLSPSEDRDSKYIDLLSQSVKINSNGSSGSGTIIYYDQNYSYVISCGHLWSGNKNFNDNNKPKAKITTWYKNNTKLDKPQVYEAEVLFWSNQRGYDVSCLRFKSDWIPNYLNVASANCTFKDNLKLNSLGCDGGEEVARYEVFYKEKNVDIITTKNSPRPGRSGGGLITDEGVFVGICWGTSDTTSGNGFGFFTPLDSIYKIFEENSHVWVLKSNQIMPFQNIPIFDWQKFEKSRKNNFIPVPELIF